jgi:hypothetical protein
MHSPHRRDPGRERAERAFVALGYVLERRESHLLHALSHPCNLAQNTARALGHKDKQQRARILATELTPIVRALDARRPQCR